MFRRSIVIGALFAAFAGAAGAATPPPSPSLGVLFSEGMTARQMTGRVAAVRTIAIRKRHVRPVLTGKSYAAALTAVPPPHGFAGAKRGNLEGFLFPSLYRFGASTTATTLIGQQLQAFALNWAKVDFSAARARGTTPYQVLIVASMVERETVAPEERPLVAAVIYNRLAKGMPLSIDATIRYGLGIPGTKPLTRAELDEDTPYNTRLHKGLPPTPIGNPGLASMRAAAHPATVDYLYYVRMPDHVHHFFTADDKEFCQKAAEYGYGC
ncbi:MAG: endolytic transglycosylase MltG [Gaiellaceae bacterium]